MALGFTLGTPLLRMRDPFLNVLPSVTLGSLHITADGLTVVLLLPKSQQIGSLHNSTTAGRYNFCTNQGPEARAPLVGMLGL